MNGWAMQEQTWSIGTSYHIPNERQFGCVGGVQSSVQRPVKCAETMQAGGGRNVSDRDAAAVPGWEGTGCQRRYKRVALPPSICCALPSLHCSTVQREYLHFKTSPSEAKGLRRRDTVLGLVVRPIGARDDPGQEFSELTHCDIEGPLYPMLGIPLPRECASTTSRISLR